MGHFLSELEIFYHVATLQSFSKTARKLGVSKGYVSQQISQLELELNIKLLHRTTRQLRLTEAGEILLASGEKIFREQKIALSLIEELKTEPAGDLKVSAPPSLCSGYLATIIPKFLKEYPNINVLLDASSSMKNLFKENIDVAIRITAQPDQNYIAKRLTNFNFVIAATPTYLKQHARITKPQDLKSHNCLIYSRDPAANVWPFFEGQQFTEITVAGNLKSSSSTVIHSALLKGVGITRLPSYVVQNDLASNKIIALLTDYNQSTVPIYALYPSTYTTSIKIKCFIDFLKKHPLY